MEGFDGGVAGMQAPFALKAVEEVSLCGFCSTNINYSYQDPDIAAHKLFAQGL